jgi:hypothetical protein
MTSNRIIWACRLAEGLREKKKEGEKKKKKRKKKRKNV